MRKSLCTWVSTGSLEALKMVGFGRTILAAVLATALISSTVAAQSGSTSLIHTVTVTVPPRVKVQVGSFSPATRAVRLGNLDSSTQGLSVRVNASQAWTLSVAAGPDVATSSIRWSRDASTGYAGLTSSEVTIASGALSSQPSAANVFFRDATRGSTPDSNATSVVLTVSAP
ncbi:MAG: hypothetical protein ACRD3J_22400 [Thermoanaerobaculia bacterium]